MQKSHQHALNKLFNQAIAEKSKSIAPAFIPKRRADEARHTTCSCKRMRSRSAVSHCFLSANPCCALFRTESFDSRAPGLQDEEEAVDPTEPERILAAFKKKDFFKRAALPARPSEVCRASISRLY